MVQVSIIRNSVVTNQASFPSQEEAQAWLSSHEAMGSFGHKDIFASQEVLISEEVRGAVQVLVSEATFDQYGDEIDPAVYEINPDGVISPAVYETQQVLVSPATYSVEIVDITAQLAQEATNVAALKLLADTDWMILRELDSGVPCSVEIKDARAAARASIVR